MNMRRLPIKNLLRRPGRTVALVLLTAFLALSVFGGSVVILSLRQGLKSLESRLGADIIVVPSSAQSRVSFKNMLLQGTTGAFYMPADNLTRTLEVEGVEKAAAQVFLASLKADCCSVKIQVIGIDPETDFTIQPWIEQSYSRGLEELEVVVGTNVQATVGEILKIYDQRCRVVGRLAQTGTGLDTAVYCSMDTMKLLLKAAEEKGISHDVTSSSDDRISAIYVKVKEGYDIGAVNSRIQGHTRKASAVRTRSMLTDISGSLSGVARTVSVLVAAIWVLCLAILLIAFAMMAGERKKEFAVLRLIGTSRKLLGRLMFTETALCSLTGALLGVAAASMLVFPFTTLIETTLGLPYLTPPLRTVLLLGAAAAAASVLAGALSSATAAFRLTRIDPGTVLREN